MRGINFVKDPSGKLKEIRIAAQGTQSQLISDIQRLIRIRTRIQSTELQLVATTTSTYTRMSLSQFQEMIHTSKASGEISESAFFQQHPEWQK